MQQILLNLIQQKVIKKKSKAILAIFLKKETLMQTNNK